MLFCRQQKKLQKNVYSHEKELDTTNEKGSADNTFCTDNSDNIVENDKTEVQSYTNINDKKYTYECCKKNTPENMFESVIGTRIQQNTYEIYTPLDKDERALEDVVIDDTLRQMGLSVPHDEEKNECAISTTELRDILESENESDEEYALITDSNVDAYRIQTGTMNGKCIMDFGYVFEQLHKTFDNHMSGIQCNFQDWTFVGAHAQGLKNKLFFKCRMCNYESSIWSEPPSTEVLDSNTGAVAGTLLSGTGYTQLKEILSAIDVQCMASATYQKIHKTVARGFEKAAADSMTEAADEERTLALQRNDVINGIPHVTVIGDGSWIKRSYRTGRYDSLSGVGTICGAESGKVLHMAVRNKYCRICINAEKRQERARSHECFKNWGRDCSSTSMEASAIVEGFKKSVDKHGLIYSTYIADGDSSVYKKIISSNPYPNVVVEKIECRNHLLRNLANKIKEIAKTKGRFGKLRNIISNRILRIRTAVTKAVQYRLQEDTTMTEKIKLLKKDLSNVISHVFGEHKDCAKIGYFCDGSQKENEENYIPQLTMCGLYDKLLHVLEQVSWNAKSLLRDKDSNRVETFNSVISKNIGGKRINFGLKGSYEARCNAAAVSFNTGEPISRLCKVLGTKPGQNAVLLEEERKIEKKRASGIKRSKYVYNEKRAIADKDYGPQAEKPDAEPEEMNARIERHMEMLRDWQRKRDMIEAETKEQSATGIWQYYRTKMITASHFGHICKMRPTTSCASRVQCIIYPQELNVESILHGIKHEEAARKCIEKALDININKCGLFIDAEVPFLGASPDGLIDNNGIVEIKCPFAARFLTPQDAIAANVSNLRALYNNEKDEHMKRNHIYYYQIQGQLHITQRAYCIFAIWTPLGLKTEKILRDDTFWSEKMVQKLTRFYEQCIIPEIIDPRRERNMPIRDPNYVIEAKKRKMEEKEITEHKNKQRKHVVQ